MYRLTAGIMVVYNSKIFMGLTSTSKTFGGYWNMPQGGIEKGESAFDAAARELKEETGIWDVKWVDETDWFVCDLPPNIEKPKRYKNLKGQKHKWFLCFCNSEPEITLCRYEYVKYEWVDEDELMLRISGSFKESLYRYVVSKFSRHLPTYRINNSF